MQAYLSSANNCDEQWMYCTFGGFGLPLYHIFKSAMKFFPLPPADKDNDCSTPLLLATAYIIFMLVLLGVPIVLLGIIWLPIGCVLGIAWPLYNRIKK